MSTRSQQRRWAVVVSWDGSPDMIHGPYRKSDKAASEATRLVSALEKYHPGTDGPPDWRVQIVPVEGGPVTVSEYRA